MVTLSSITEIGTRRHNVPSGVMGRRKTLGARDVTGNL